ncbi:glutathione S-transferase-like protein [Mycena epipterygia]|nr:glutathione S-transferase-like protein [Mycena epipterygia]
MVLKFYCGGLGAGGAAAVAMTLFEKQTPFELVVVDLTKGEHKRPAHLAIQPFGLVPVIDDDGLVLYESRAICRYLAEKYAKQGTALIPTELKAKAFFEQAAAVEFAHFEPLAHEVYVEGIAKPRNGTPVDPVALDKVIADLSAKLDVYEKILGTQEYIAGDEFTLADVFHVSFGSLLERGGCNLLTTKGPNIARYFRRIICWNSIRARPSWVIVGTELKSTATY